jgi:hypothetical protein
LFGKLIQTISLICQNIRKKGGNKEYARILDYGMYHAGITQRFPGPARNNPEERIKLCLLEKSFFEIPL